MSTIDTTARPPVAALPRRNVLGADWRLGYMLSLPIMIIIFGLVAYPFLYSVWLSLNDIKLGGQGTFVGLNNYYKLLFDTNARVHDAFLNSVQVSIVYTVAALLFKFFVGMITALILHAKIVGRNLWRALLFLPWAIPAVVSAWSWKWMFNDINGVLNTMLLRGGLIEAPILWLGDINIAMWSVLLAVTWQGTPFWTMTMLAGMQSIPGEIYEAAQIDGASTWQSFWSITLPNLTSVIVVTFMLSGIWTANGVQYVYILTNGGPAGATETFPMLALTQGIRSFDLGIGATIPLIFMPIFAVMIYFLTRRMLREEA
ncbi:MAG: sugar ABC transporter permease [Chloroflexi bacterium]|nr:sugar ABC transporter permease [Chloroflexota bacterium]